MSVVQYSIMKIFVIHGEDVGKSYERLKKFIDTARARSYEVSVVDESNLNFTETLSGISIFGNERFFILKNIKKFGKKEAEWLNKNYTNLPGNLVIYHEGIINVALLKSLPKEVKIEEFPIPKLIWNFLDHLYPGNSIKCVQEFHKIIEHDAPEFVFSVIAKHFRDLCWSKIDPVSMPYPTWRTAKLKAQSSKFSEEKLKAIIENLTKIDVDVKTSKSDLTSSLDLLLIKQLE